MDLLHYDITFSVRFPSIVRLKFLAQEKSKFMYMNTAVFTQLKSS